eukprot:scaffold7641_cov115-Cylindrotheca_fusiformis.AAC.19
MSISMSGLMLDVESSTSISFEISPRACFEVLRPQQVDGTRSMALFVSMYSQRKSCSLAFDGVLWLGKFRNTYGGGMGRQITNSLNFGFLADPSVST